MDEKRRFSDTGITQRVTVVETQIGTLKEEQARMHAISDKQTVLLEQVIKQQDKHVLETAAIKERTEDHNKTIEHLQANEADISKILSSVQLQMSVARNIATVFLTVIVGYLFSHFIH